MSDNTAQVTVRILDREYQIACPADERSDLLNSAALLNRKMREIRDVGKVIGLDRIAIMAALNLSHELLRASGTDERLETQLAQRLKILRERVDNAVEKSRQPDF